jgi:hypothetical protein
VYGLRCIEVESADVGIAVTGSLSGLHFGCQRPE